MKAVIVVFPGSNRDGDVARALRLSGAEVASVWHTETALPPGTDLAVLPGGFSYGDYLRCGAIARFSPVMESVRAHAERGGLVIGICNGFQILCESGLLPGVLRPNASLQFICRQADLEVADTELVMADAEQVAEQDAAQRAHEKARAAVEAVRNATGENPWRDKSDDEIAEFILKKVDERRGSRA